MDLHLLLQLTINGLIVGALYGVVAMCFVLIYKASQVVNFAQGEFLLIGAWVCWWLLTKYQLPFYAAFLVTLAFMMAFGFILQVVVLRPLIGEPVISVIMVTIGLSIFFQALMKWMFGVFAQPFPPIFETRSVNVLGLEVQTVYVMSTAVSAVIMAGFAWFFKFSRMGLAMRATAFDQQVAQSLGISIRQVFALSWGIAAMLSAVAGVVVGVVNGVSSALSFFGIKVFPAVILGGLDSIVGAVVGGLVIGVLSSVLPQYVGWLEKMPLAPVFILILAVLLFRPEGLFGRKQVSRV
jgi:branched-chain amino acid transport system permease protein